MTEMDNRMTLAKSDAAAPRVKTTRQKKSIASLAGKTLTGREKVPKWLADGNGSQSIFSFAQSALVDQIVCVRKGLPSSYVAEMSEALAMTRTSFLDSLQLPRSTIEDRIKKNTPLTPSEGDAVLRAAKALAKAEEVFEERAYASDWLKREIRSLGGVTPVSLMDTGSGFALVMNTLGRIEHGVVA